jgi:hypothetical protein
VYNDEDTNFRENNVYLASQILNCGMLDDTLTGSSPCEEVSPFLLDAIYRSALIYIEEYMLTGDQHVLRGVIEFKSVFERINERWKSAGEAPYCGDFWISSNYI